MRKIVVYVCLFAILVSTVVSFSGCGAKSEIKSLIKNYEKACNELDFNSILECVDPRVSDSLNMAADFVGMFTDMNADELFERLAGLLSSSKYGGKEFFSTIKIDIQDIEVEEKDATVSAIVTYTVGGTEYVREATFKCIYYVEEWYISTYSIN